MARPRRVMGALLLVSLVAWATGPAGPAWAKSEAVVSGSFVGAPASIPPGTPVDVVLRVTASHDAPDVVVEVLLPDGVELLGGLPSWIGPLARGQVLDLPLRLRVVGAPSHALGARITARFPGGAVEVSGAVLPLEAPAAVGPGPVPQGPELPGPPGPPATVDLPAEFQPGSPLAAAARGAVSRAPSGTVRGVAQWRDAEGHAHPIRGAGIGIYELVGPGGQLRAQGVTGADGSFSVPLNLGHEASVFAVAFSSDFVGQRVHVLVPDTINNYQAPSIAVPLQADTECPILTAPLVRVRPGVAFTDSVAARAFSVFDAFRTYQSQGDALVGVALPGLIVHFPRVDGGTTAFRRSDKIIRVLQGDALDWDILGHEYFHFLIDAAAPELTNSPGGTHSSASAIGENGRSRDDGMLLAWSEGLASFLPVVILRSPMPGAAFGVPASLQGVGDTIYDDTEDQEIPVDMDNPPLSVGYGSERSVMGLLWDLFDGVADGIGGVTETFAGANAKVVWDALTDFLPCFPCDRVDRLWDGLALQFGINSPTTLTLAKAFVVNNIAPRATGPADGTSLAGGLRPTFTWIPNGDPDPAHQTDTFYLAFSRDNFQNYRIIPVPGTGSTSYQLTQDEWDSVVTGAPTGATFQWLVAGRRGDAPTVPDGLIFLSNVLNFRARGLHARITWDKPGADVDLHLETPLGEIWYVNKSVAGVGFLDRDCTTQCTEENISVESLPSGAYRLFIRYFDPHGQGSTRVHAEVFNGGQRVLNENYTLSTKNQEITIVSETLKFVGEPDPAPVPAGPPRIYPPKTAVEVR